MVPWSRCLSSRDEPLVPGWNLWKSAPSAPQILPRAPPDAPLEKTVSGAGDALHRGAGAEYDHDIEVLGLKREGDDRLVQHRGKTSQEPSDPVLGPITRVVARVEVDMMDLDLGHSTVEIARDRTGAATEPSDGDVPTVERNGPHRVHQRSGCFSQCDQVLALGTGREAFDVIGPVLLAGVLGVSTPVRAQFIRFTFE